MKGGMKGGVNRALARLLELYSVNPEFCSDPHLPPLTPLRATTLTHHTSSGPLYPPDMQTFVCQVVSYPVTAACVPSLAKERHLITGASDLQRLSSNLLLLLGLHAAQGAHVVQAVRQLDHDDPYFFSHGKEQLPQVLGLDVSARRHARDLADLAEPRFPLDDSPDCRAKPVADLLEGDVVCVLHGVMQQACRCDLE